MLNKYDFEFLQPSFVEEVSAEKESNETIAYAQQFHLIEDEIADFFLAPADATRVHYRTMNVRKEENGSACGIFVATCLVEFDDVGNIVPSPMFKHRTNYLKSDGSRPEYRPFEAAPRKEGHETWESVASVKVTDLVLVPFDEEGVSLEETYSYKGTPEGFLKAQNAGLNGNGFDFDPTIVSLGFLKNQVNPASFKKEMNQRLNQLGATNGLFEVFIWGFASEVLTSSSESRDTESVFVNTNNFSMGVRPYRTSNKRNGISRSNRGFKQGRDFASRLVQRQKARDGKKVSPLGTPMEEEIDKATEPAPAPEPAPTPKPTPEPAPEPALDDKLVGKLKEKRPNAYNLLLKHGIDKFSKGTIRAHVLWAKSDDQAVSWINEELGISPEPTSEENEFGGIDFSGEEDTDEDDDTHILTGKPGNSKGGFGTEAERSQKKEEKKEAEKPASDSSSRGRGRGRGMNANAKPAPTLSQEEVENKLDNLSNG